MSDKFTKDMEFSPNYKRPAKFRDHHHPRIFLVKEFCKTMKNSIKEFNDKELNMWIEQISFRKHKRFAPGISVCDMCSQCTSENWIDGYYKIGRFHICCDCEIKGFNELKQTIEKYLENLTYMEWDELTHHNFEGIRGKCCWDDNCTEYSNDIIMITDINKFGICSDCLIQCFQKDKGYKGNIELRCSNSEIKKMNLRSSKKKDLKRLI